MLRSELVPSILRFRNPLKGIRAYGRSRGMSYMVDVRDWLGGYPYEYAYAGDIFRFCHRELQLELVNVQTTNSLGTNEFLFRRST